MCVCSHVVHAELLHVCSSADRCVCCFMFPLTLTCSLHHCRRSMVVTVCATSQRTDRQPNWLPPSATPIDGTPDVTFLSTCLIQSIIEYRARRKPLCSNRVPQGSERWGETRQCYSGSDWQCNWLCIAVCIVTITVIL